MYLTNKFFSAMLISSALFCVGINHYTELGLPLIKSPISYCDRGERSEKQDVSSLTSEEKALYIQLGPLYQRIFLYALTPEMRRRAVIYMCRGLTPFEAVNVILRAEQRKFEAQNRKKSLTPCERSMMQRKESMTNPDITGQL